MYNDVEMDKNVESKEMYLKWYYLWKRYYVTIRSWIVNPRKFNWRNLPMSTSTSMSLSVSMVTDTDMDVDIGRWTRTQTETWTDPEFFRHFFHSTFFPPVGLFFPFGDLSHSAFFHSTFFPFGVSYYSTFCPIWRFFHSTFCPIRRFFHSMFSRWMFFTFGVCYFEILSVNRTFGRQEQQGWICKNLSPSSIRMIPSKCWTVCAALSISYYYEFLKDS